MGKMMHLVKWFPLLALIGLHYLFAPAHTVSVPGNIANLNTLVQVQVIFRHGSRYALGPILSDEHERNLPKDTWGRLKDKGKKQLFELGKYFRKRYSTFVSKKYDENEVYALSSDKERTIASGQLAMLGFYKEFVDAASWDLSYPKAIEPIPLRTIFKTQDNIISMDKPCRNKKTNFRRPFTKEHYWLEYLNKPEIRRIAEKAGYSYVLNSNLSNFNRLWDFGLIVDNIACKKMDNDPVPDWAEDAWKNEDFFKFKSSFFLSETSLAKQRLMTGGPLLQFLNNNMEKSIARSPDSKKVVFLSSHDLTLIYLFASLGMLESSPKYDLPTFAVALMIELHRDKNEGDFFVQLWYRNETDTLPHNLLIPGCEQPCAFSTFQQITKAYIPEDWEKVCNEADTSAHTGAGTKSTQTFLSLLQLVFVSTFIMYACRKSLRL